MQEEERGQNFPRPSYQAWLELGASRRDPLPRHLNAHPLRRPAGHLACNKIWVQVALMCQHLIMHKFHCGMRSLQCTAD